MLTYQLRPRYLKRREGQPPPTFPADAVVNFSFRPLQAFGAATEGGRTVVHNTTAQVFFNAINGQCYSNTNGHLPPLEIVGTDGRLELRGNKLTIRSRVVDFNDLRALIDTICFALSPLLAIEFADPPYVDIIDGTLDGVAFTWELTHIAFSMLVATQESLETAFVQAHSDLEIVGAPHRRRLVAALGYFHAGCRLLREEKTAGEFMSEALLNFAKVIEVLYGTTRETTDPPLRQLGYTNDEIDRDFRVVLDLRNSVDVGHTTLAQLTVEQSNTIRWFAHRTERVMRDFLRRLISAIRGGSADVPGREAGSPDGSMLKVLERLTQLRAQADKNA